jgi:hypothetical protein
VPGSRRALAGGNSIESRGPGDLFPCRDLGADRIERFLRLVSYQNVPEELLADEIRTENLLGIWRRVDGTVTRD